MHRVSLSALRSAASDRLTRVSRCQRHAPSGTRISRLRLPGALMVGLAACLISVMEARAAELVMFESPNCEWCEAWDREVGVVYHKTAEGQLAPLRRVQLHGSWPEGLESLDAVVYTPTFVLMAEGRELGRISGYPGEDHFWGLLGALLKGLHTATKSRTAE